MNAQNHQAESVRSYLGGEPGGEAEPGAESALKESNSRLQCWVGVVSLSLTKRRPSQKRAATFAAMSSEMLNRHVEEVENAFVAVRRLRMAAGASASIGLVGAALTIVTMVDGSMEFSSGVLILVAFALATVFPAAALYSASYRVSLRAVQLEARLSKQMKKQA